MSTLASAARLTVMTYAALGAVSCAEVMNPAEAEELAITASSTEQQDSPVGPAGEGASPKIVAVRASGTGCPAGTYDAKIVQNGQSVQVEFADYSLAGKEDIQTKNCAITLDVSAPGVSIAVSSFKMAGYAFLTAGTTADQFASYTFVGGLGTSAIGTDTSRLEHRETLNPPFDGPTAFHDIVEPERLTFSTCGRPSQVLLNTRLALRSRSAGFGYVNVGAVSDVQFVTRPCGATTQDDGPVADAGLSSDAGSPQQPIISNVRAIGNLCPPGSTTVSVSPDGTDFNLKVQADPVSAIAACNVTFSVAPPAGYMFTIDGFDARGQVAVEGGAQARVRSSFRFVGRPSEDDKRSDFVIDKSGSASFGPDFSAEKDKAYSACGSKQPVILTIGTIIENDSAPAAGTIQLTDIGGVRIRLKKCE